MPAIRSSRALMLAAVLAVASCAQDGSDDQPGPVGPRPGTGDLQLVDPGTTGVSVPPPRPKPVSPDDGEILRWLWSNNVWANLNLPVRFEWTAPEIEFAAGSPIGPQVFIPTKFFELCVTTAGTCAESSEPGARLYRTASRSRRAGSVPPPNHLNVLLAHEEFQGRQFEWSVRACADAQAGQIRCSGWSAPRTLLWAVPPPDMWGGDADGDGVTDIQPPYGATFDRFRQGDIRFRWPPVSNATEYFLCLWIPPKTAADCLYAGVAATPQNARTVITTGGTEKLVTSGFGVFEDQVVSWKVGACNRDLIEELGILEQAFEQDLQAAFELGICDYSRYVYAVRFPPAVD